MAVAADRLRAVDLLLLGYLAFVSLVALARPGVHARGWLLLSNALTAALIFLLTRDGLGRFGRGLREVYPILLLTSLYAGLDLLNGGGAVQVYDREVQRWEAALFGGQPSRDWWRTAPNAFWSFVLHGAYFSYYGILLVPTVVFVGRRQLPALRRFMIAVMTTFVVCYIWFVLLPVAGPYYEFSRPTGEFVANPMAQLVYAVLAAGSSYGAAFPSSHVAASVAATIASWHASRTLGAGLALPTGLLTVGVVYCQMHYAVDAVAGLLVGGLIGVVLTSDAVEVAPAHAKAKGGSGSHRNPLETDDSTPVTGP